jgi:hypothetical protein
VAIETQTTPIQFGHQITPDENTHAHELNQEGFLSLSTPDSLTNLVSQGKALEISIEPELEQLSQLQAQGHDGYLNITLPMVGVTDYLSTDSSTSAQHAFGSVLGLNHFVADSGQPHFSRPDFIVAKDIIGNQYEILLDNHGKVMVPEDGTGKFSLLSEVKLMYSLDQVLEGRGLESNNSSGNLYLLPPPGFQGKYSPVISVSQTQDDFSEKELTSRKTPILLQDINSDPHSGFSETGLQNLSKYLFTEYDFTKAILSGDEMGVKHANGLNDFGLSPEAIGVYYDLWLSSVVNHQISADNLFTRINPDDLLGIQNLDELGLSAAEQLSLQTVLNKAKLGDFSGLHDLYQPDFKHADNVYQNLGDHEITIHDNLSDLSLSSHDNVTGKTIALNFDDVFAPGDHPGAIISGFNVNHDKLDLSNLLNQLPNMHIDNLSANLHGQDVQINYQDPHTGQVQTLATLVSGAPDNHLPDLLHYLNLNHD